MKLQGIAETSPRGSIPRLPVGKTDSSSDGKAEERGGLRFERKLDCDLQDQGYRRGACAATQLIFLAVWCPLLSEV